MVLSPGSLLGIYEIVAPIGAGGMGEVYRARDTKLGREVAIKILPEDFAHDPERLARFKREAQLLASLNHPNIAGIHGLEEHEETLLLSLELVEGEDLSERLKRGPIPVDEALDIARHIADALEAAHEKGIIHRDLKPPNIKLTPDGNVKVLDFGLAKALDSNERSSSELSNSPTMARDATRAGVILGTASYMSPEQARGKVVDKRTDIWAFGCVLYEMLTGHKVFQGEDVTFTLAELTVVAQGRAEIFLTGQQILGVPVVGLVATATVSVQAPTSPVYTLDATGILEINTSGTERNGVAPHGVVGERYCCIQSV